MSNDTFSGGLSIPIDSSKYEMLKNNLNSIKLQIELKNIELNELLEKKILIEMMEENVRKYFE